MCLSPASILYKSIAGRCRPVSYPDGPVRLITARYRFVQNAYCGVLSDMCTQGRLSSACTFAQSDQNVFGHILDSQGCNVSSCGQQ